MAFFGGAVGKVTTDDDKPVSGFALKELAELARSSTNECDSIIKDLKGRLGSRSSNVKLKALKAIKYVAQSGPSDFRIYFQRNHDDVKGCVGYTGPPDPLKGDKPYEKVREAAKEALVAIFNAAPQEANPQPQLGGRIEGYGSQGSGGQDGIRGGDWSNNRDNSGVRGASGERDDTSRDWQGGIYSSPSTNSKYAGYGSHPIEKAKPSFFDKVVGSAFGTTGGPEHRGGQRGNAHGNEGGGGEYRHYQGSSAYSNNDIAQTDESLATSKRGRGQVGGVWGSTETARPALNTNNYNNNTNNSSSNNNNNSGGSFGQNSSSSGSGSGSGSSTMSGGSYNNEPAEPSDYEIKLVDDICVATGIRAQPSKAELDDFKRKSQVLDMYVIAKLLDKKLLLDNPPATTLKALCVLDELLANRCDRADDYFNDHPDNLFALEQSGSGTVQVMTAKVLVHVGLRDKPQQTQQQQPTQYAQLNLTPQRQQQQLQQQPPVKQQQQPVDLFDIMGGGSSSSTSQSTDAGVKSAGDMFSNLQIKSKTALTGTTSRPVDANSFDPMNFSASPSKQGTFSSSSSSSSSASASSSSSPASAFAFVVESEASRSRSASLSNGGNSAFAFMASPDGSASSSSSSSASVSSSLDFLSQGPPVPVASGKDPLDRLMVGRQHQQVNAILSGAPISMSMSASPQQRMHIGHGGAGGGMASMGMGGLNINMNMNAMSSSSHDPYFGSGGNKQAAATGIPSSVAYDPFGDITVDSPVSKGAAAFGASKDGKIAGGNAGSGGSAFGFVNQSPSDSFDFVSDMMKR